MKFDTPIPSSDPQSKAEHSASQAASVQTQYRETLQTANDLELRVAELETTLKLREDELQVRQSAHDGDEKMGPDACTGCRQHVGSPQTTR